VRPVLDALRAGGVHALAHITGGGLTENLPRVLPRGLGAAIDLGAWRLPPVFGWLAQAGGVAEAEMLKTFNAGIGMVVVAAAESADDVAARLTDAGETLVRLGEVTEGQGVTYRGALL
jgi:phosphoribosylformylglycinamidine cyclo-ligase